MNERAKNICIDEMVSETVGLQIWKEAQKEFIKRLKKRVLNFRGYSDVIRYSSDDIIKMIDEETKN